MSKELEACFKEIYHEIEYVYANKVDDLSNPNWDNDIKHYHNIRGNVLTIQRYLEQINTANLSAKPSEALEYFKKLKIEVQDEIGWYYTGYVVREQKIHKFDGIFDIIEPTLITKCKKEQAFDGIVDYLDLRIKTEPNDDVRKAFEEIRKHIDVLAEVVS